MQYAGRKISFSYDGISMRGKSKCKKYEPIQVNEQVDCAFLQGFWPPKQITYSSNNADLFNNELDYGTRKIRFYFKW